jgi:hypothetical protein
MLSLKPNKVIKLFSFILSLSLYLIFVFLNDFNSLEEGYKITILLPLVFLFCFYGFLWEPVIQKKTPYLVLFPCVAFVRYVVLSIATVWNGTYIGISRVSPSVDNLTLAGILMSWELIVTSILICYWSKRKIKRAPNEIKILTSNANPIIYIFFIITVISLMLIVPQAQQGLSFFGNINRSINDDVGSLIVLGIRECFINAKYFLLFFVIILLSRKDNANFSKNKLFSYFCILAVCILIIGFRIGTNRKKLLADSLAAMLLLWNLFPKYKKTTATLIIAVGIMLVAVTTVFRGMTDSIGMFFYDYFNLDFLQPYFLGQYNVAIAIEAKFFYGEMIDIKTYLLSFLRSVFGIGAIVKNYDFTTISDLFNNRVSWGINGFRTDQIPPMIGQGYMLFGIIFSPLLSAITARMGILFDSLYVKEDKIEIVFVSSAISFYLAQGMILNANIILNALSFRLAIFIPIVYIGYITANKSIRKNRDCLYSGKDTG